MVTQEKRATATSASMSPLPTVGTVGSWHRVPEQWRWLLPVTVVAATVAWLAGTLSGTVDGRTRLTLVVAGAVFTAMAAGIPLWEQARTAYARADAVAAARSARAAMRIAVEDALDPFVALLLQLSTARAAEKARLRGEAMQVALTTIGQLAGLNGEESSTRRLRVCFFAVDEGPPRRLLPQSYAGRSGSPTVTFDETTRAGQFLLRVLHSGWVIVRDVAEQRSGVWWDEERAYRTFAAGPVLGPDGEPVGLLTIDGLVPGDLDSLDLPLTRLMADLLSLGLRL